MGLSGARDALIMKDAQTKAGIADVEMKALSRMRVRDVEGAIADKSVTRRIRNEVIAGLLVLAFIASFLYVLVFVL